MVTFNTIMPVNLFGPNALAGAPQMANPVAASMAQFGVAASWAPMLIPEIVGEQTAILGASRFAPTASAAMATILANTVEPQQPYVRLPIPGEDEYGNKIQPPVDAPKVPQKPVIRRGIMIINGGTSDEDDDGDGSVTIRPDDGFVDPGYVDPGWLSPARHCSNGLMTMVAKKGAETHVRIGSNPPNVQTILVPVDEAKYEVARGLELSLDWDPVKRAFGITKGFGFVIIRGEFPLVGSGFIFCSRVTMYDPSTGIRVDSHLPVDHEHVRSFDEDVDALERKLQKAGVDIRNGIFEVVYGTADSREFGADAPGYHVALRLKARGLNVRRVLAARSVNSQYILDQTGANTLIPVSRKANR